MEWAACFLAGSPFYCRKSNIINIIYTEIQAEKVLTT